MSDATWSLLRTSITVIWLVIGAFTAGHAIMYKRDPRSAAIWIFICFTVPIVGPWFYWAFGFNRIERRAMRRLGERLEPWAKRKKAVDRKAEERDAEAIGHLATLQRTSDRITSLPLLPGNLVEPLHNGEECYPAMLSAIMLAQKSITLESYIFDHDDVGKDFCRALGAAAERGVKVHVIVDGIGALGNFSRMGRMLLKTGAQVKSFFPLLFPLGRIRFNLRNHRKIMVVDGKVGFTGGINISSRHYLNQTAAHRVEDLHFRITGPAVAQLQHAFCDDWVTVSGQQLSGADYFPELSNVGVALCRAITSGPDEDLDKLQQVILAALAAAQKNVRIVTPYFIPPPMLVGVINLASLRGVKVTIQLPSKVDLQFMRWAADAYLWQFLIHGVEIVHRPPPFVHTKLMIIDDRWILLGSANMDRRSFRLNFEFNVEVYDVELATRLGTWVDQQNAEGEKVTLEAMDSRPVWKRLRDGFVRLFSPHL